MGRAIDNDYIQDAGLKLFEAERPSQDARAVRRGPGTCRSMASMEKPVIMKGTEDGTMAKLGAIGPMVQRARDAQAEWASWSLEKRKSSLIRARDLLLERREDIADLISRETGKPSLEAVGTDILTSLVAADHSARSMRKLFATRQVRFENMGLMMWYMGRRSYVQSRPLGVIGIIVPWNYPLAIPFSQTVMALAAGNAVTVKPSPEAPLTSMAMQRLLDDAGLPKPLVQTFMGGDDHGRALVASGVDRIVFTGSSEAGKQVMTLAAQRLTPVTLELGGKTPRHPRGRGPRKGRRRRGVGGVRERWADMHMREAGVCAREGPRPLPGASPGPRLRPETGGGRGCGHRAAVQRGRAAEHGGDGKRGGQGRRHGPGRREEA